MNRPLVISLLATASMCGALAAHGCGICEAGWAALGAAAEGFPLTDLAPAAGEPVPENVALAVELPKVSAVTTTGPAGRETVITVNLPAIRAGPQATARERLIAGAIDALLGLLAMVLGGTSIVLVWRGGKLQRLPQGTPPPPSTP